MFQDASAGMGAQCWVGDSRVISCCGTCSATPSPRGSLLTQVWPNLSKSRRSASHFLWIWLLLFNFPSIVWDKLEYRWTKWGRSKSSQLAFGSVCCPLQHISEDHRVTQLPPLHLSADLSFSLSPLKNIIIVHIFIVKMFFMQAPSQPCGWASYAPQWSQVERTNRPSSGRSRAKQLSLLHRLQLESGTTSATYWTVLAKYRVKCMTQLYSGKKRTSQCTEAHSRWREKMTSNLSRHEKRVTYSMHIISAYCEEKNPAVLCMKAGSVFTPYFHFPFQFLISFFFCSFMCILSYGVKKYIFSLLRCYQ